jgi:hypothetical protein
MPIFSIKKGLGTTLPGGRPIGIKTITTTGRPLGMIKDPHIPQQGEFTTKRSSIIRTFETAPQQLVKLKSKVIQQPQTIINDTKRPKFNVMKQETHDKLVEKSVMNPSGLFSGILILATIWWLRKK